jgi:hypothetical protein
VQLHIAAVASNSLALNFWTVQMGWIKRLVGGTDGVREAIREKYEFLASQNRAAISETESIHAFSLHNTMGMRYAERGTIWATAMHVSCDIAPFLLMRESESVDALVEYILLQDQVSGCRKEWLRLLLNNAILNPAVIPPKPILLELADSISRIGYEHTHWYKLLDSPAKNVVSIYMFVDMYEKEKARNDGIIGNVQVTESVPSLAKLSTPADSIKSENPIYEYGENFNEMLAGVIKEALALAGPKAFNKTFELYPVTLTNAATFTGLKLDLPEKVAVALMIKREADAFDKQPSIDTQAWNERSNEHSRLRKYGAGLTAAFGGQTESFYEELNALLPPCENHILLIDSSASHSAREFSDIYVTRIEGGNAIFRCPECSQNMTAPSHKFLNIKCRKCNNKFQIHT